MIIFFKFPSNTKYLLLLNIKQFNIELNNLHKSFEQEQYKHKCNHYFRTMKHSYL